METIVNDIGKENPQLFKSYYVVWKHTIEDNYSLPENTFKSYYVVWKPERGKI